MKPRKDQNDVAKGGSSTSATSTATATDSGTEQEPDTELLLREHPFRAAVVRCGVRATFVALALVFHFFAAADGGVLFGRDHDALLLECALFAAVFLQEKAHFDVTRQLLAFLLFRFCFTYHGTALGTHYFFQDQE